MRARCFNVTNKCYNHYGGRGITVCERWLQFPNFLADMGERPEGFTIERINNDGNYEPGNCRWATRAEQTFNTRTTVQITINGTTMCAAEWSRYAGLSVGVVARRYREGLRGEALISPGQGKLKSYNATLLQQARLHASP